MAILEDLTLLSGCRDGADTRYDAKRIAVGDQDEEVGCMAERSPASHDRIEYRLNVGRRAADDTQDLGGRRLLFQRLGQGTLQVRIRRR